MDVPERLKQLMMERNLTIYSLAKASGLHWQTIKNLFTRTSNPSVATMTDICNGLGITMSQFFAEGKDNSLVLTEEQSYVLERWNAISSHEKKVISDMLDIMLKNQK